MSRVALDGFILVGFAILVACNLENGSSICYMIECGKNEDSVDVCGAK
jgi:hypothetical protein